MKFLKGNKLKISFAAAAALVLIFALCMTGYSPEKELKTEPQQQIETAYEEEFTEPLEQEEKSSEAVQEQKEEKKELYCTLSVSCDTLLKDISRLDENKCELVGNGIIFSAKQVKFEEGESVFDVLLREMRENKIHLEFVNTPVYDSVYIEGIGNIYEFDAGELSGWMYKVNGEFPNFGCSKYILKNGDRVEFVYTCDLGKDVGGNYYENIGEQL